MSRAVMFRLSWPDCAELLSFAEYASLTVDELAGSRVQVDLVTPTVAALSREARRAVATAVQVVWQTLRDFAPDMTEDELRVAVDAAVERGAARWGAAS
jgi:hypothetical protein